jgi:hypothetical protein
MGLESELSLNASSSRHQHMFILPPGPRFFIPTGIKRPQKIWEIVIFKI